MAHSKALNAPQGRTLTLILIQIVIIQGVTSGSSGVLPCNAMHPNSYPQVTHTLIHSHPPPRGSMYCGGGVHITPEIFAKFLRNTDFYTDYGVVRLCTLPCSVLLTFVLFSSLPSETYKNVTNLSAGCVL